MQQSTPHHQTTKPQVIHPLIASLQTEISRALESELNEYITNKKNPNKTTAAMYYQRKESRLRIPDPGKEKKYLLTMGGKKANFIGPYRIVVEFSKVMHSHFLTFDERLNHIEKIVKEVYDSSYVLWGKAIVNSAYNVVSTVTSYIPSFWGTSNPTPQPSVEEQKVNSELSQSKQQFDDFVKKFRKRVNEYFKTIQQNTVFSQENQPAVELYDIAHAIYMVAYRKERTQILNLESNLAVSHNVQKSNNHEERLRVYGVIDYIKKVFEQKKAAAGYENLDMDYTELKAVFEEECLDKARGGCLKSDIVVMSTHTIVNTIVSAYCIRLQKKEKEHQKSLPDFQLQLSKKEKELLEQQEKLQQKEKSSSKAQEEIEKLQNERKKLQEELNNHQKQLEQLKEKDLENLGVSQVNQEAVEQIKLEKEQELEKLRNAISNKQKYVDIVSRTANVFARKYAKTNRRATEYGEKIDEQERKISKLGNHAKKYEKDYLYEKGRIEKLHKDLEYVRKQLENHEKTHKTEVRDVNQKLIRMKRDDRKKEIEIKRLRRQLEVTKRKDEQQKKTIAALQKKVKNVNESDQTHSSPFWTNGQQQKQTDKQEQSTRRKRQQPQRRVKR